MDRDWEVGFESERLVVLDRRGMDEHKDLCRFWEGEESVEQLEGPGRGGYEWRVPSNTSSPEEAFPTLLYKHTCHADHTGTPNKASREGPTPLGPLSA